LIDLKFVGTILNFFLCRRWLLLGHQVRTTNNRIIVKLRERDREHYFSKLWSSRLKRGGSGHLNYFLPAVCSRRAMTWGVKTATRSLYSASSATSVSIKSSCAFKELGYLILLSLWLSYNLNNNNNYWGKAFIFYLHLLYHFQIFQIIVFKSSFIKTNIYNLVLYKLLSLPIFYWLFYPRNVWTSLKVHYIIRQFTIWHA